MRIHQFQKRLNQLGKSATPFIFIVDFELKKPLVFKFDEIDPKLFLFDLNGVTNKNTEYCAPPSIELLLRPYPELNYNQKFDRVSNAIHRGDSFLTNLTIRSQVELSHSLKDIFYASKAKYKLWHKEEFVVFSPEPFIRIKQNKIFSFPMKGTMDAAIPQASQLLLTSKKEMAEHVTIVDLIRSDLSRVATEVNVKKFRYIEELRTNRKNLLQVSSQIEGRLPDNYCEKIGDILVALLPAGSVSGAPKSKTLQLITEAEGEDRGYYTGVCGYFDGQSLDSGVMIRYLEKKGDEYYYRSGGGITSQSNREAEYQEVINKIYVPVD